MSSWTSYLTPSQSYPAQNNYGKAYRTSEGFFPQDQQTTFNIKKLFIWIKAHIIAYFPRSFLLLLLLLLVVFWSLWLPGPPGPMMFLFDRHTHVHTWVWGGKISFWSWRKYSNFVWSGFGNFFIDPKKSFLVLQPNYALSFNVPDLCTEFIRLSASPIHSRLIMAYRPIQSIPFTAFILP